LRLFKPILAGVRSGDRLLACFGASFSIAFSILVCSTLPLHGSDFPLVVAPLGASAVLVFTVPSSPMAQPWPVIGGNIVSTMIGVVIYQAIPNMELAASIAVGAAILIMSLLRCLHPPGGASALTAVIGSDAIHTAGIGFALLRWFGIYSNSGHGIFLFYRNWNLPEGSGGAKLHWD
jgi:CBS domain-containing membrane protein